MAEQDDMPVYKYLDAVHDEDQALGQAIEGVECMALRYDLSITEDDILVYLERHPYLQLLNLDPTFEDFDEVKIIKSPADWSIQDFGDALSTSQGEHLFQGFGPITLFADAKGDQKVGEGEEGDIGTSDIVPGMGTVVKQAFDTAVAMVDRVKERWTGIHIVAGSEIMKWAAWVAANDLGLDVYGYEADKRAEARYQRIKRYEMQRASTKQPGRGRE